ncbi:MAG: tyrosine-type recombinase/integrase, partial [Bacteroidota bacterium]
YLFTRLIYYGFLRPVELCRMRVQHINLNRRSIVIPAELTKNHTQQGIYIVDPLLEELETIGLQKLRPTDYLFSKKLLPGEYQIARKVATARHRTALKETAQCH